MKNSLQTSTLLIVGLLTFGVVTQSLVDNRNSYCAGKNFDPRLLSPGELSSMRNASYTDFYSNYTKLFNYYNDSSSSNFIQLMNYQFGLYITLVLLIVILFIVFLVACCWKCTYGYNCWHECLWIFLVFFVIFIALFITIIVYIGISQNKASNAYCSVFSLPAAILYGNPGVYHSQEFIGYQSFINLMGNFTSEVPKIGTKLTDMTAIINAQLATQTQTTITNDLTFWKGFANSQVSNGVGVSQIPDVVIKSPPSVSLEIESEFNNLDSLARDLIISASEGKFMSNPVYVADTQVGLTNLTTSLNNNFKNLSSTFNGYSDKAFLVQSYALGGFWTFFAMSIVIIILGILCAILLCGMKYGRCRRCITCLRISLIFMAFFAIIYGICVLILMAGISGVSSFCRFVGELNQGGWVAANTFTSFLGASTGGLVKNCFFKNGTGFIPDIIGSQPYVSNSFNRLIDLVQGMTSYRIYTANNPGFTNTTSVAIQDQITVWNNISNGYAFDNINALNSFASFSNAGSCDPKKYQLTNNACTQFKISSCSGISSSSAYSPGSCITSPGLQNTIYTNLYQYITSEQTLLSSMITGIGTGPGAANTKAITNFQSVNQNVLNFRSVIPNTVSTVANFNNSLLQITQCSNIQVEMVQFERYACFPFTKPLYKLFVLAAVSTFILFIMLIALFIAICFKEDDARNLPVIRKEEFLAVSEQELVPAYYDTINLPTNGQGREKPLYGSNKSSNNFYESKTLAVVRNESNMEVREDEIVPEY